MKNIRNIIIFTLSVLTLGYLGILIAAHTKDNFVIGHDYYWHGKKFATQPDDCSGSVFDVATGEVKFFGCGKDNNETIVIHPKKEGKSIIQKQIDSQMKPMNDAIKKGDL